MIDLWAREPQVLEQPVPAPIVVTGLSRSAPTFLHELLACDPDNRPPLLWELLHTVPYDEASGDLCDAEITLMDEMIPSFTAMHENGGRLPTECIFVFAHQFSTDMYTGTVNVPGYTVWRSGVDQAPIYDWHRRHLQTLQWVAERPTTRWVVKAPSPISLLCLCSLRPTRTPGSSSPTTTRCVSSGRWPTSWLRSTPCIRTRSKPRGPGRVHDHGPRAADGLGHRQRDAGTIPNDQITDVIYRDLITDPLSVIEQLYAAWDPRAERGVPGPSRGLPRRTHHATRAFGHDYSFADTGLDLATHRALATPYQERFGVPSEV